MQAYWMDGDDAVPHLQHSRYARLIKIKMMWIALPGQRHGFYAPGAPRQHQVGQSRAPARVGAKPLECSSLQI